MGIKSRCTECGAESSGSGGIVHAMTCTAALLEPKIGYGMRPPATELVFDTPEEQEAFMKKLKGSSGAFSVHANTTAKSELAQPKSPSGNTELELKTLTYNLGVYNDDGDDVTEWYWGQVKALIDQAATNRCIEELRALLSVPEHEPVQPKYRTGRDGIKVYETTIGGPRLLTAEEAIKHRIAELQAQLDKDK